MEAPVHWSECEGLVARAEVPYGRLRALVPPEFTIARHAGDTAEVLLEDLLCGHVAGGERVWSGAATFSVYVPVIPREASWVDDDLPAAFVLERFAASPASTAAFERLGIPHTPVSRQADHAGAAGFRSHQHRFDWPQGSLAVHYHADDGRSTEGEGAAWYWFPAADGGYHRAYVHRGYAFDGTFVQVGAVTGEGSHPLHTLMLAGRAVDWTGQALATLDELWLVETTRYAEAAQEATRPLPPTRTTVQTFMY